MAVGRFQVMAILQAARAFVLGEPMPTAQSWGLNRAIFYAAAKRGFKPKPHITKPPKFKLELDKKKIAQIQKSFGIYHLGDEMAYSVELEGKRLFTIGDEVQTPEHFEKQVASRLGKKFEKVWKEAIEICQSYDKGVLLSMHYFYETVYKPRRDVLVDKWNEYLENKK
ncbi:MAG: hypothetical protein N2748_03725 [candidate division WOR-3 bacterium]|nr:hypothetical protein [candidate division WOR-3 bacterium]